MGLRPQPAEACVRSALLVIALKVALLAVFAGAGCGDTTTTRYCSYDSDCPDTGERFCVNGICRAVECLEDRDCDDDQSCVEGVCSN